MALGRRELLERGLWFFGIGIVFGFMRVLSFWLFQCCFCFFGLRIAGGIGQKLSYPQFMAKKVEVADLERVMHESGPGNI